jgi:lipoprotein-anchoring transpeptidase ErfK/SrfK
MQRPCLSFWVSLAAVLASCASDPRYSAARVAYLGGASQSTRLEGAPSWDNVSYWDGDGVAGAPRLEINIAKQRAYFYKGRELVGVSVVSTGREGFGTPSGEFKVVQKDINHRSSLYGDYVDAAGNVVKKDVDVNKDRRPPGTRFRGAPMPYFLRIHGGIGVHAGYLPGYPASHGCIRLPERTAQNFFDNVRAGTPVEVIN